MKKLLSLPPNVVGAFHHITGLSPKEYFCTSDPADHKLGSGGGTAWLLNAAHADEAPNQDFNTWLAQEKRILLHAGGQSRRLPAYAPSGKVLTPIPVFRWARGQQIDQTLLDLQLPLYSEIMRKAPQSLHTLVASGDVLLRATEPLQEIPEADVVCYGLWADPAQASHHGVFMMNRQSPTSLDFMLQKPSTDEQAQLMQTHLMLMDIGVWLLSDKAVERLIQKTQNQVCYDLYSEFGCALGEHPSRPDALLADLKVAILPLPGGEFYHYGTGNDMIASSVAIQNLVKDQRYILQKGIKPQTSVFTQNALIANHPTPDTHNVWIENAYLGKGWHYTSNNIVTGVPQNNWTIYLPKGVCVDIVPIGEKAFAVRPYGFNDAFRGDTTQATTLFMERPLTEWLKKRGIAANELQNTTDLQAAKLFPVTENVDELGELINWFIADNLQAAQGNSEIENIPSLNTEDFKRITEKWRSLPRYSADELSIHANLSRLFKQRRALQAQTLSIVAKNWQRSVFYQVNLKDMAQKFSASQWTLPANLPESAPLMTRIHDAMFRSECLRATDAPQAAQFEDKAFSLLREGLTENVLRHKSSPRMTTYADQIVWARSSVRIDVAGGWTDTPPYSLISGGNVVNLAINLNGQPPLQVYVKPCKEPVIICRSIDLGAMERIETYDELKLYNKVGSPFSIPKAALTLAGFLPGFSEESFPTLRQQLEAFGCGMEITLLAAIPAGSGLGTSSVLAATVLAALSDFCGLNWDKNEICNRTLVLEQLLTTGGGWQDQYGGVLPGVKLLQTSTGFDQNAVARWLPDTLFTDDAMCPCHLLYYTGITRTAKNILAEIVRGMFLNNTRHLRLLNGMKQHALTMFDAMQTNNLEKFGRMVRTTWEQNKALDAGTNPEVIETLCQRVDDLCYGYKLPGAGGGGFMYMVAKDAEAARRIKQMLTENPLTPNSRFVDMSISTKGLQVSRS